MLYCSERANTHIEHGAKGAYREIRSYNRYLQPTGIIKRMHTAIYMEKSKKLIERFLGVQPYHYLMEGDNFSWEFHCMYRKIMIIYQYRIPL